jgi:ABC transporter family protein
MVSCVQTEDITRRPCAVRARGITKCFGDVVALDGVDLDVAAGQIHGVVGPNGAGKTRLFGLLLGLVVADRGTLEVLARRSGGRLRLLTVSLALSTAPVSTPHCPPGEPRRVGRSSRSRRSDGGDRRRPRAGRARRCRQRQGTWLLPRDASAARACRRPAHPRSGCSGPLAWDCPRWAYCCLPSRRW